MLCGEAMGVPQDNGNARIGSGHNVAPRAKDASAWTAQLQPSR
jgi:hypothetical protein